MVRMTTYPFMLKSRTGDVQNDYMKYSMLLTYKLTNLKLV